MLADALLAAFGNEQLVALGDEAPIDSMMQFLLRHAPCTLRLRDVIALDPPTSRDDGVTRLRGICRHCRVVDELEVASDLDPTRAARWWLVLMVALPRCHQDQFVDPADGSLTAAYIDCLQALATAIDFCAMLTRLAESDPPVTH